MTPRLITCSGCGYQTDDFMAWAKHSCAAPSRVFDLDPLTTSTVFAGTVVKGLGVARHTVKAQLAEIVKLFQSFGDERKVALFSGLFPSTINVACNHAFVFGKPDIRIGPMPNNPVMCEFFDMWHAELRVRTNTQTEFHRGLVYRSSDSIHRLNPCMMEFVMPPIANCPLPGDEVQFCFQATAKELKWFGVGTGI